MTPASRASSVTRPTVDLFQQFKIVPKKVPALTLHNLAFIPTRTRLQAKDVSELAHVQPDAAHQLQTLLQEVAHLLRVRHVAEHPDLRMLPLDVGVARGQAGAPGGSAQSLPYLRRASET